MAKYALVIGIDRYNHFSNLKSAAKDAEAVAQLLGSQDYRVTRLPRKLVDENQWAIGQRHSSWNIASDKPLPYDTLKTELLGFSKTELGLRQKKKKRCRELGIRILDFRIWILEGDVLLRRLRDRLHNRYHCSRRRSPLR